MRTSESYKLKGEILGVALEDESGARVMIPKGSTVTVVGGTLQGARMMDVTWNGKAIMIFAQDLRERGQSIDGAESQFTA